MHECHDLATLCISNIIDRADYEACKFLEKAIMKRLDNLKEKAKEAVKNRAIEISSIFEIENVRILTKSYSSTMFKKESDYYKIIFTIGYRSYELSESNWLQIYDIYNPFSVNVTRNKDNIVGIKPMYEKNSKWKRLNELEYPYFVKFLDLCEYRDEFYNLYKSIAGPL